MSNFPYGMKPAASYNVTVGAASAVSAQPVTFGCRVIRLVSTTNCWVRIGPGTPVANTTTDSYLPASVPDYFQVSGSGTESVAVIQQSAGGTLNITDMTL